tara:strand:+ start:483 stop:1067 length:585 start_codon:yes stop_codon:yes gene_type:complete
MVVVISLSLVSCGISKEIRAASIKLVEKQKISLAAHVSFHDATVKTISIYLDSELIKSKTKFEGAVKMQIEALSDIQKEISSSTIFSDEEKKIKEAAAKKIIQERILKSEGVYKAKIDLIIKAKNILLSASSNLILGEEAKSNAIESINKYLQAKKPSEYLFEKINIDLEKYAKYVLDANGAIDEVKKYINLIK